MWQPKWQQWTVIWITFVLAFIATGGSDSKTLIPFIVIGGALLVWMLQKKRSTGIA